MSKNKSKIADGHVTELTQALEACMYALRYYQDGATNAPKNDREEAIAREEALRKGSLAVQSAYAFSVSPEQMRAEADKLLRSAIGVDGLRPFFIIRRDKDPLRCSVPYIGWGKDRPTVKSAESIMDSEFHPFDPEYEFIEIKDHLFVPQLCGSHPKVMLKAPCQYEAGDKVFVPSERRLATVLDTYGDGVHGSHGDMRLDLCGNTSIDKFEPYDPKLHAEYDPTFIPIMRQWKEEYGITQDVQIREDNEQVAADALAFLEQHRVDEDAPTQIPM